MLVILTQKQLRELEQKAEQRGYDVGITEGITLGCELGYKMCQCDSTNRGFIIGSRIQGEADEILRRKL